MLIRFIIVSVAMILLSGCSSSSRVVLLEGKKAQSSVIVTMDRGCKRILDTPNSYTVLSSTQAKPSNTKVMNKTELEAEYGALIEAAPKPPQEFLLYFEPGSTTMTDPSTVLLPEIVMAIGNRQPCDVNIIGHADRMGSEEYNVSLSLKRAQRVNQWLLGADVTAERITVESYGESNPLVPTADGVGEPKNRRVEVSIR